MWREACAPLYICNCSSCERQKAIIEAQNAGSTRAQQAQPHEAAPVSHPPTQYPVQTNGGMDNEWPPETQVAGILADVASTVNAACVPVQPVAPAIEEEEEEDGEDDEDDEDDEEFSDSDGYDDTHVTAPIADHRVLSSSPAHVSPAMPRKRSSRDLDDDEDSPVTSGAGVDDTRGGSPPKKARTDTYAHVDLDRQSPAFDKKTVRATSMDSLAVPRLSKKRSSEELDDEDADVVVQGGAKRCRTMGTTGSAELVSHADVAISRAEARS